MTATGERRPTIIDVARAAGVSKSLVSLAVRGDAGVSTATRTRILQVAESLGYRSNTWARSLARGRTQLVGVLLTDLHNTYHTEIVHGIEDRATELGYAVTLSHGRRDAAVLRSRMDSLLDLGVDGLIVVSALLDRAGLEAAVRRGPTVVVGRPLGLPTAAGGVANHDEHGAALAIEHLVALGHRSIAHLSMSRREAARVREQSYLAAMRRFGLEEHSRVWHEADGGVVALADALGTARGPTAVFASNDRGAVELLGAAVDRGLRVPDDVSIVGYDNTELARAIRPALTSVDQPRLAMGARAMEMLVELMAEPSHARHEVVEPRLIVRGSTARFDEAPLALSPRAPR